MLNPAIALLIRIAAVRQQDLSVSLMNIHSRTLRPGMVIGAIYFRITARGDDHVWILLIPR
jgi:hypothetical protein